MIVDQFGRPVHSVRFVTPPAWILEEFRAVSDRQESDQRVRDLRQSLDLDQMRVGQTVHVRLPQRYQKTNNGAGA